jgi:hypothetical protein
MSGGSQREGVSGARWHQITMPDLFRSLLFLRKKGASNKEGVSNDIFYSLVSFYNGSTPISHEIEKPIFNVFLKCTIMMLTITFNSKSIILW